MVPGFFESLSLAFFSAEFTGGGDPLELFENSVQIIFVAASRQQSDLAQGQRRSIQMLLS
jgi:hypothetical protein